MEKIKDLFKSFMSCVWLPVSGADKFCHFGAGFIIAVISFIFLPGAWVLIPLVTAAVLKEAIDEYNYGGADFFDLFATILGGVIGIMIMGVIF